MKKENLISFEDFKKSDNQEFCSNYLSNIDAIGWIEQISKFGGRVFLESDCIDEVYIDIGGMNKKQVIDFFLFISKSKPDEFSEISKNFLRVWWD